MSLKSRIPMALLMGAAFSTGANADELSDLKATVEILKQEMEAMKVKLATPVPAAVASQSTAAAPQPTAQGPTGLAALGGPITLTQTQNVTVETYGVIDAGVQRDTNVGGRQVSRVETRHDPTFWGLRARLELGSGLTAFARIEQSFNADTGATGTGFSREALVGMSHPQYGTLQIGRQYDPMAELIAVDPPRYNSVTAVHSGNYDHTAGNFQPNAVKYRTPVLYDLSAQVLISLKEDGTSATNTGRAGGAAITYNPGPYRISAAYYSIDGVTLRPNNDLGVQNLFNTSFLNQPAKTIVAKQEIAGVGAYYNFMGMRLFGEFTSTKLFANNVTERLNATAVALYRDPNAVGFKPGIGFTTQKLSGSRWNTVYAIADYYFTPKLDAYLRVLSQRAHGDGTVAALFLEGPSSTNAQTVYGTGLTLRFN